MVIFGGRNMKFIKLLSLIAAACLVSCVDETAYENSLGQQGPETMNPEYTHFITFVASSDATKIEHNGTDVKWNAGDKIRIYFEGGSAESLGAVLSDEGAAASFTIPLEAPLADDAKIYAVYPSTTTASLDGEIFNVTIPAEQSAIYRNADILAACTTVGDASLFFRHVAGLVCFTISEGNPKGIDSGVFKDFYKSAAIAGTCPLTFGNDGKMTIGTAVDTKSEIILKDIQAGENYIAVVPEVTMESVGLKLKANGKFLTPKATDNDLVVSAAHIRPVGVVDTDMSDAYYIKSGATGNGTSWTDAAGVSLISDLMSTPLPKADDTYQRRAAAWRLDGQEIRIAQGDYELPGTMNTETGSPFTFQATYLLSKATFTIDGGYDADGNRSATAKAAFTGKNSHPIMALWSGVNATINNVVFKDARNEIYGDSANNGIGQIGGAIDLDNTCVVTFNNCEFLNNKSTTYTGGALAITQNGTKATFNSCLFDGNESAKNGGAVFIGNAGATFDMCTFVRNKTTGNGGGAIFFNNDARNNTLTITNSVFGGTSADYANSSNAGGAALLLSNGKKVTVSGTTFQNNKAPDVRVGGYHSAVLIAGPSKTDDYNALVPVDFTDCRFVGNAGGAVAMSSCWPTSKADSYKGEFVSFDKCHFDGNKSSARGAGLWVAGTLPVFLNACTFKNNTLAGTQGTGSTISMVAASSGTSGMLAMNNCTVSGGVYGPTNTAKDGEGDVYLRGKSIVANCTLLGEGVVPELQYNYSASWGNPDGSVLVNSIVCGKTTTSFGGTYSPIRLAWVSDVTFAIKGYYNLYQEIDAKGHHDKYTKNATDDSVITKAWSDFNFTETNYGTTDDPNYLFDYSIPAGSTVTKVPTVEEVAAAIKSQTTARKSGYVFGTMFYNWLTSIGAADKDARGKVRTVNRQGALVK